MTLTPTEIDEYIQSLQSGQTISWGEGDPDPYGGGAHWLTEFFFHTQQKRIFSVDSYWPSQYHPDPETRKWAAYSIAEFKKIIAQYKKHSISVSYSPPAIKIAFDEYEQHLAMFEDAAFHYSPAHAEHLHGRPKKPMTYDDYIALFARAKSD